MKSRRMSWKTACLMAVCFACGMAADRAMGASSTTPAASNFLHLFNVLHVHAEARALGDPGYLPHEVAGVKHLDGRLAVDHLAAVNPAAFVDRQV